MVPCAGNLYYCYVLTIMMRSRFHVQQGASHDISVLLRICLLVRCAILGVVANSFSTHAGTEEVAVVAESSDDDDPPPRARRRIR